MESLGNLLKKRVVEAKKLPKYEWQELAMTIIREFDCLESQKSTVFKYCKLDYQKARQVYAECRELNKTYVLYFFKLMTLKK